MGVEDVAEELYTLRPDEFVAARDEHARRARAAGHRELAAAIGTLRKPSTAAWVVNLLVRRAGDQVDRLLDLGESLRTAQASLAGDALKELGRQRGQVVAAMGREGRRLAREAGHPVSAGIEEEVVGTLRAALADPRAARAVRTGRLTSALSYSGLGEVGPESATASPKAVPEPGSEPEPVGPEGTGGGARVSGERRREAERLARERREARAALAEAERAYDEAAAAQSAATVALQDARADQDRAQARVAELAEALRRAQEDAAGATAAVRPRRREHDSARHALDVARRAVDRARARVDRLDA